MQEAINRFDEPPRLIWEADAQMVDPKRTVPTQPNRGIFLHARYRARSQRPIPFMAVDSGAVVDERFWPLSVAASKWSGLLWSGICACLPAYLSVCPSSQHFPITHDGPSESRNDRQHRPVAEEAGGQTGRQVKGFIIFIMTLADPNLRRRERRRRRRRPPWAITTTAARTIY